MPRFRPDVYLSHPSWFIVPSQFKDGAGSSGGTQQSRITAKDAAHQTDPPPIQDCMLSRFIGGCLLSVDLDQIELRTAALLSGEPFFLDAFSVDPPLDVHSLAALRIWGEPECRRRYPTLASLPLSRWKKGCPEWAKRERQVGKRTNFAHLFRSGPDTMQAAVHGDIGEMLPLSIFQKIASSRQSELPVLWDWQESLIAEAAAKGRIYLPLTGIARTFAGGDKYEVNEIVNFPIQATAATAMLQLQHEVHRLLHTRSLTHRILPFLNCYDALYFDCDSKESADLALSIYNEALLHLTTVGYWGKLQSLYGRVVRVTAESKLLSS